MSIVAEALARQDEERDRLATHAAAAIGRPYVYVVVSYYWSFNSSLNETYAPEQRTAAVLARLREVDAHWRRVVRVRLATYGEEVYG